MPFVKKTVSLFLLFIIIFNHAGAQETEDINSEEKSLYPALLGGLFANTIFHLAARIYGDDCAQTSLESFKTNLTSPWVWDNDIFFLNNPGHPYQGGLYHTAARANGFNFYESIFFNVIGSWMWEVFGETDTPSLNDLLITTFGGAAFGEMMHLLYLEIRSPWAGALVSPIDALNNAVWRRKPSRTNNIFYLSAMTGHGWIQVIQEDKEQLRSLLDNQIRPTRSHVFTGNIGCEVIYGNPFDQNSVKPYSQFEIKMLVGSSFYPLWLDWTILTDGYLLSYNPLYTEKNILSTGLTLHYDLITGNNINFASNALDWSLKWRHEFKTSHLELKSHIGWTFFGSSQYYPFAEVIGKNLELYGAENNFGTGGNLKLFFTVQTQKFGKITLGFCNYLLYIIPWKKPDSRGIEYFSLSNLEYSYYFSKNISLVLNSSVYLKVGNSYRKSDVVLIANRIILAIRWTFLNKGTVIK
jgi:hypothetical protein